MENGVENIFYLHLNAIYHIKLYSLQGDHMRHKIFFALIMGSLSMSQVCAMEGGIEDLPLEKMPKPISFLIFNDSNKVTFSNQDYPLPSKGDLGTLTNLRFRLIPGAITGKNKRFVHWMNYNSPYNPSIPLPDIESVANNNIILRDSMAISLSSQEEYEVNNHSYKDFLPEDISITNDIKNSHLLTIVYSFNAPEKLNELLDGSKGIVKYCYSRTFTLSKTIDDIQTIVLSFSGFERGIDKPSLSVSINEESMAEVSGYTQNHSQNDLAELELDTGTYAWAAELALIFRTECQNKNKEKFTQENFIAFLKDQLEKGNTLNYNPQLQSIAAAVEELGLF